MMKKRLFRALLLLTICPVFVRAQKTVTHDQQTWFGVFSQVRLSDRWGLWFDGHLRLRDDFIGEPTTGIFRPGLTYYAYDDLRITAGYAYVHHFPGEGHENVAQPEHRPWQQVQWFTRFPNLRLMNWVRLEERFRRKILNDDALAEGYYFNWRARFNLIAFLPLTKKKFAPGSWQFVVNDELHVNFGENIVYNFFDQNRLFLGLVYQVNAHAQVQGGYMNLYLQQASGNRFQSRHTIRLFYFHNFDLRKGQSGH